MARLIDRIEGHRDILVKLIDDLNNERLPSCLLFTGPVGVGKRLVAKSLAQVANCEFDNQQACGQCGSCLRIVQDQSEAIFELKASGQHIKIDDAREAIRFFELEKINRARFLIIDDAELLNIQAANSLLKTLEEPPKDSYIILVTALPWKLLPTIRSRAVKIQFHALSISSLRKLVPNAPNWVLNASLGQVGKAQELVTWETNGVRDWAQKLLTHLVRELDITDESVQALLPNREQALIVIRFLGTLVRDLIWWKHFRHTEGLINTDRVQWIERFNSKYSKNLDWLFQKIQSLELHIKQNADPHLAFEHFLIEAANDVN